MATGISGYLAELRRKKPSDVVPFALRRRLSFRRRKRSKKSREHEGSEDGAEEALDLSSKRRDRGGREADGAGGPRLSGGSVVRAEQRRFSFRKRRSKQRSAEGEQHRSRAVSEPI